MCVLDTDKDGNCPRHPNGCPRSESEPTIVRHPDINAMSLIDSNAELLKAFPTLAEIEKQHILAALAHTNNNRTQAAKILGIALRTLRNKLSRYAAESAIFERETIS